MVPIQRVDSGNVYNPQNRNGNIEVKGLTYSPANNQVSFKIEGIIKPDDRLVIIDSKGVIVNATTAKHLAPNVREYSICPGKITNSVFIERINPSGGKIRIPVFVAEEALTSSVSSSLTGSRLSIATTGLDPNNTFIFLAPKNSVEGVFNDNGTFKAFVSVKKLSEFKGIDINKLRNGLSPYIYTITPDGKWSLKKIDIPENPSISVANQDSAEQALRARVLPMPIQQVSMDGSKAKQGVIVLNIKGFPDVDDVDDKEKSQAYKTFLEYILNSQLVGEKKYSIPDINKVVSGWGVFQNVSLIIDVKALAEILELDELKLVSLINENLYKANTDGWSTYKKDNGLSDDFSVGAFTAENVNQLFIMDLVSSLYSSHYNNKSNIFNHIIKGRNNNSDIEEVMKILLSLQKGADISTIKASANKDMALFIMCILKMDIKKSSDLMNIRITETSDGALIEYNDQKFVFSGTSMMEFLGKENIKGLLNKYTFTDISPQNVLGVINSQFNYSSVLESLSIDKEWSDNKVYELLGVTQESQETKEFLSNIFNGKVFIIRQGNSLLVRDSETNQDRKLTVEEKKLLKILLKVFSDMGLMPSGINVMNLDRNSSLFESLGKEIEDYILYFLFGVDGRFNKDSLVNILLYLNKVDEQKSNDPLKSTLTETLRNPGLREKYESSLSDFLNVTKIWDNDLGKERSLTEQEKAKALIMFHKVSLGLEVVKKDNVLEENTDPFLAFYYRCLRTGGGVLTGALIASSKKDGSLEKLKNDVLEAINIEFKKPIANLKGRSRIEIFGVLSEKDHADFSVFLRALEAKYGITISININKNDKTENPGVNLYVQYDFKPGYWNAYMRDSISSSNLDVITSNILLAEKHLDRNQSFTFGDLYKDYRDSSGDNRVMYENYLVQALEQVLNIPNEQALQILQGDISKYFYLFGVSISLIRTDRHLSGYEVHVAKDNVYYMFEALTKTLGRLPTNEDFSNGNVHKILKDWAINYAQVNQFGSTALDTTSDKSKVEDVFRKMLTGNFKITEQEKAFLLSQLVGIIHNDSTEGSQDYLAKLIDLNRIIEGLISGDLTLNFKEGFKLQAKGEKGEKILLVIGKNLSNYESRFFQVFMSPEIVRKSMDIEIGGNYFGLVESYLASQVGRLQTYYQNTQRGVLEVYGRDLIADTFQLKEKMELTEMMSYDELLADRPLLCVKLALYDRFLDSSNVDFASFGSSQLQEISSPIIDLEVYSKLLIRFKENMPEGVRVALNNLSKSNVSFSSWDVLEKEAETNSDAGVLLRYLSSIYFQVMINSSKQDYGGELQMEVLSAMSKTPLQNNAFVNKEGLLGIINNMQDRSWWQETLATVGIQDEVDAEIVWQRLIDRFPQVKGLLPQGFNMTKEETSKLFANVSTNWNSKEILAGESDQDTLAKLFIYELANLSSEKYTLGVTNNAFTRGVSSLTRAIHNDNLVLQRMLYVRIFKSVPNNLEDPLSGLNGKQIQEILNFYESEIAPSLGKIKVSPTHEDIEFLYLYLKDCIVNNGFNEGDDSFDRFKSILITLWKQIDLDKLQERDKKYSLTRQVYQLARLDETKALLDKHGVKTYAELPEQVRKDFEKNTDVKVSFGNVATKEQTQSSIDFLKTWGHTPESVQEAFKDNGQGLRQQEDLRSIGWSATKVGLRVLTYDMFSRIGGLPEMAFKGIHALLDLWLLAESDLEREYIAEQTKQLFAQIGMVLINPNEMLAMMATMGAMDAYGNKIVGGKDVSYEFYKGLSWWITVGFSSYMYASILAGGEHMVNKAVLTVKDGNVTIMINGKTHTMSNQRATHVLPEMIRDAELLSGRVALIRSGVPVEEAYKYDEQVVRELGRNDLRIVQYSQEHKIGISLGQAWGKWGINWRQLFENVKQDLNTFSQNRKDQNTPWSSMIRRESIAYENIRNRDSFWQGQMTEAERIEAYSRAGQILPVRGEPGFLASTFERNRYSLLRPYLGEGNVGELVVAQRSLSAQDKDFHRKLEAEQQRAERGANQGFFRREVVGRVIRAPGFLWSTLGYGPVRNILRLGSASVNHAELIDFRIGTSTKYDPNVRMTRDINVEIIEGRPVYADNEKVFKLHTITQRELVRLQVFMGNLDSRIVECLFDRGLENIGNRLATADDSLITFRADYDKRLLALIADTHSTPELRKQAEVALSVLRFRKGGTESSPIYYSMANRALQLQTKKNVAFEESQLETAFVRSIFSGQDTTVGDANNVIRENNVLYLIVDGKRLSITKVVMENDRKTADIRFETPAAVGAHLPEVVLYIPRAWMLLPQNKQAESIQALLVMISNVEVKLDKMMPANKPGVVAESKAREIVGGFFRLETDSEITRPVSDARNSSANSPTVVSSDLFDVLVKLRERYTDEESYKACLVAIQQKYQARDTVERIQQYAFEHVFLKLGESGLGRTADIQLMVAIQSKFPQAEVTLENIQGKRVLVVKTNHDSSPIQKIEISSSFVDGRVCSVIKYFDDKNQEITSGDVIKTKNELLASFESSRFPNILSQGSQKEDSITLLVRGGNASDVQLGKSIDIQAKQSLATQLEHFQKEAEEVHRGEYALFQMSNKELVAEHERIQGKMQAMFDGKRPDAVVLSDPKYRELSILAIGLSQEAMRRFYWEDKPFKGVSDYDSRWESSGNSIDRFFTAKVLLDERILVHLSELRYIGKNNSGVYEFTIADKKIVDKQNPDGRPVTLQDVVNEITRTFGLDFKDVAFGLRINPQTVWATLATTHGRGMFIDQACGEGKTMVSILASYVLSLTGKDRGINLVTTTTEQLAGETCRFANQMFDRWFLGKKAGFKAGDYVKLVTSGDSLDVQRTGYSAAITVAAGDVPYFDYEKDALEPDLAKKIMGGRRLFSMICDESDQILILEDKVSRILSAASGDKTYNDRFYLAIDRVAETMLRLGNENLRLALGENNKVRIGIDLSRGEVISKIILPALDLMAKDSDKDKAKDAKETATLIRQQMSAGNTVFLSVTARQLLNSLDARLNFDSGEYSVQGKEVKLVDVNKNLSEGRKLSLGKQAAVEAMVCNGRTKGFLHSSFKLVKGLVDGRGETVVPTPVNISPTTSSSLQMGTHSFFPRFTFFAGMSGTNSPYSVNYLNMGRLTTVVPRGNEFRLNHKETVIYESAVKRLADAMDFFKIGRFTNGFEDRDAVSKANEVNFAPFQLVVCQSPAEVNQYAKLALWAEIQRLSDGVTFTEDTKTAIMEKINDLDLKYEDFVKQIGTYLPEEQRDAIAIEAAIKNVVVFSGELSSEEQSKRRQQEVGLNQIVIASLAAARGMNFKDRYVDAMKKLSSAFFDNGMVRFNSKDTYTKEKVEETIKGLIASLSKEKGTEAERHSLEVFLAGFLKQFSGNESPSQNDILRFLRRTVNIHDNDNVERRTARRAIAFASRNLKYEDEYIRVAQEVMKDFGLTEPSLVGLKENGVDDKGKTQYVLASMKVVGDDITYTGEIDMRIRKLLALAEGTERTSLTELEKLAIIADATRMRDFITGSEGQADRTKARKASLEMIGRQVASLIEETGISGVLALRERFAGNCFIGVGFNPVSIVQDIQAFSRVARTGADGVARFWAAMDDAIFTTYLPGVAERGNYIQELLIGAKAFDDKGRLKQEGLYKLVEQYVQKIRNEATKENGGSASNPLEKIAFDFIDWQNNVISVKNVDGLIASYRDLNDKIIRYTFEQITDENQRIYFLREIFGLSKEEVDSLRNAEGKIIEESLRERVNFKFNLMYGDLRLAEIDIDRVSQDFKVDGTKLRSALVSLQCVDPEVGRLLLRVPTIGELMKFDFSFEASKSIIEHLTRVTESRFSVLREALIGNNMPVAFIIFIAKFREKSKAVYNKEGVRIIAHDDVRVEQECAVFLGTFYRQNVAILEHFRDSSSYSLGENIEAAIQRGEGDVITINASKLTPEQIRFARAGLLRSNPNATITVVYDDARDFTDAFRVTESARESGQLFFGFMRENNVPLDKIAASIDELNKHTGDSSVEVVAGIRMSKGEDGIILKKGEQEIKISYENLAALRAFSYQDSQGLASILLRQDVNYQKFIAAIQTTIQEKNDGKVTSFDGVNVTRNNGSYTIKIGDSSFTFTDFQVRNFITIEAILRGEFRDSVNKMDTQDAFVRIMRDLFSQAERVCPPQRNDGITPPVASARNADANVQEAVVVRASDNLSIAVPFVRTIDGVEDTKHSIRIPTQILLQIDERVGAAIMEQFKKGETVDVSKALEDVLSKQDLSFLSRENLENLSDIKAGLVGYLKASPTCAGVYSALANTVKGYVTDPESFSRAMADMVRSMEKSNIDPAKLYNSSGLTDEGRRFIGQSMYGSFRSGVGEDVVMNLAQAFAVYFALAGMYALKNRGEGLSMDLFWNDQIMNDFISELSATQSYLKIAWAKRLLGAHAFSKSALGKHVPMALSFGHSMLTSAINLRTQTARSIAFDSYNRMIKGQQQQIFASYGLDYVYDKQVVCKDNDALEVTVNGVVNESLTATRKGLANTGNKFNGLKPEQQEIIQGYLNNIDNASVKIPKKQGLDEFLKKHEGKYSYQDGKLMIKGFMTVSEYKELAGIYTDAEEQKALQQFLNNDLLIYLQGNYTPEALQNILEQYADAIVAKLDLNEEDSVYIKKYILQELLDKVLPRFVLFSLGHSVDEMKYSDYLALIALPSIKSQIKNIRTQLLELVDKKVMQESYLLERLKMANYDVKPGERREYYTRIISAQENLDQTTVSRLLSFVMDYNFSALDRELSALGIPVNKAKIDYLIKSDRLMADIVVKKEVSYTEPTPKAVATYIEHQLSVMRGILRSSVYLQAENINPDWEKQGLVKRVERDGEFLGYAFVEGLELVFSEAGAAIKKGDGTVINDQEVVILFARWNEQLPGLKKTLQQYDKFKNLLSKLNSSEYASKFNESNRVSFNNELNEVLGGGTKDNVFKIENEIFFREVQRYTEQIKEMENNNGTAYPMIVFSDEKEDFYQNYSGTWNEVAEAQSGYVARGKSIAMQTLNFSIYRGTSMLAKKVLNPQTKLGGAVPEMLASMLSSTLSNWVIKPNADNQAFQDIYLGLGAFSEGFDFMGLMLPSVWFSNKFRLSEERSPWLRAATDVARILLEFAADTAVLKTAGKVAMRSADIVRHQGKTALFKQMPKGAIESIKQVGKEFVFVFKYNGVPVTHTAAANELFNKPLGQKLKEVLKKDGAALGYLVAFFALKNLGVNYFSDSENMVSDTIADTAGDLGQFAAIKTAGGLLARGSTGLQLAKANIYGAVIVEVMDAVWDNQDAFTGDYGWSGAGQAAGNVAYRGALMYASMWAAYGLAVKVGFANWAAGAAVAGGIAIYQVGDWAVDIAYENSALQMNNAEALLTDNLPFNVIVTNTGVFENNNRDYQTVLSRRSNKEVLNQLKRPLKTFYRQDQLPANIIRFINSYFSEIASKSTSLQNAQSKTTLDFTIAELFKMAGVNLIEVDHPRHLRVEVLLQILSTMIEKGISQGVTIKIEQSKTDNPSVVVGSASFNVEISKNNQVVFHDDVSINGDLQPQRYKDTSLLDVYVKEDERFVFDGKLHDSIRVGSEEWNDFFIYGNVSDNPRDTVLPMFRTFYNLHREWFIGKDSTNQEVLNKIVSTIQHGDSLDLSSSETRVAVEILGEFYKKLISEQRGNIEEESLLKCLVPNPDQFLLDYSISRGNSVRVIKHPDNLRGLYRAGVPTKTFRLMGAGGEAIGESIKEKVFIPGLEHIDLILNHFGKKIDFNAQGFRGFLIKDGILDAQGFLQERRASVIEIKIIKYFNTQGVELSNEQASVLSRYIVGRLQGIALSSQSLGLISERTVQAFEQYSKRERADMLFPINGYQRFFGDVGLSSTAASWLSESMLKNENNVELLVLLGSKNKDVFLGEMGSKISRLTPVIIRELRSSSLSQQDKYIIYRFLKDIDLSISIEGKNMDEYSRFSEYDSFSRPQIIESKRMTRIYDSSLIDFSRVTEDKFKERYLEYMFYPVHVAAEIISSDQEKSDVVAFRNVSLSSYPDSLLSIVIASRSQAALFDYPSKNTYDTYESLPKELQTAFDIFLRKHEIVNDDGKFFGFKRVFLDVVKKEVAFVTLFHLFLVSSWLDAQKTSFNGIPEMESFSKVERREIITRAFAESDNGNHLNVSTQMIRQILIQGERAKSVLDLLDTIDGVFQFHINCKRNPEYLQFALENKGIREKAKNAMQLIVKESQILEKKVQEETHPFKRQQLEKKRIMLLQLLSWFAENLK